MKQDKGEKRKEEAWTKRHLDPLLVDLSETNKLRDLRSQVTLGDVGIMVLQRVFLIPIRWRLGSFDVVWENAKEQKKGRELGYVLHVEDELLHVLHFFWMDIGNKGQKAASVPIRTENDVREKKSKYSEEKGIQR